MATAANVNSETAQDARAVEIWPAPLPRPNNKESATFTAGQEFRMMYDPWKGWISHRMVAQACWEGYAPSRRAREIG